MKKYYKIYHFSRETSLVSIDPKFFGTGICYAAFKRGGLGINKSFYFISTSGKLPDPHDRPIKYEVYMPCDWKIYDIENDPEKLYEKVRKQLAENKDYPYDWLVAEKVEKELVALGYHGRTHANGIALALFYPLSTAKPKAPSQIYDYSTEKILEEHINDLILANQKSSQTPSLGMNGTLFYSLSKSNDDDINVSSTRSYGF